MSAHAPSRCPSSRSRRSIAAVLCAVAAVGPAAIAAQSAHAVSGFTAGDVVVYRVGSGTTALSSSSAPVFLDEYSPSGTLVQSVALPTVASGSNKPLVASGTSTSEGLLTLSADGRYLTATGYDAATGVSKISGTAAATTPRTVGLVDANDNVNTSTALTDFADGNNPRSAVTSDGTNIWVGGAAGGVRYTTVGSTTSTSVLSSTYKNVRQVGIANGQLYTSADPTKASVTVATVGAGLPKSGSLTPANLPFATPPGDPYGYSFLTLGSGSSPDTLYEADLTAGAVVKYSLSNGSWVSDGSVSVPGVTGVTANDNAGVVTIFASGSNSSGTTGTLSEITDSSGLGGTLSGTATQLATAPTNEAFRGIAFAPGTTIGSGGGVKPPPVVPTITTAQTALPAAINDPTNATLGITVGDANYDPSQLTVSATSSNTAVASPSGISISGSGASRTLTVTPGSVGYSTITLTVTAPDQTTASTAITYGVSADLGDPSDRYFSGAGNASTAVDVGDGYMVVGDDESNQIRLYNTAQSGPPVKTFDFDSLLPFGSTEVDIEASARSGNTIYWTGSMSNNSSGNLAPARSTLFATTISGSGANTTLTYAGSYTGLQSDLVNWDKTNGHGLGANYFGLDNSVNGGVDSHEINALNVEGMEFAGSSSTTAYLALRAPLEPTTDRHLALVVPVTNINQLTDGAASHATFGAPLLWDLGGLGIRDIRENADGHYLIIAGTADGSNSSFVLYYWDGNPQDAPVPTNTPLPLIPAGANQGSWETILSVPDPLTTGSSVQLVQDNGDTAWYGDTATSKDTLPAALQKDLGRVFSYSPPTPNNVTVTADNQTIAYGATDPTFTYTTTGLTGSDAFTTPPTCSVAGNHTAVGTYPITCSGGVTSGSYDAITYVAGTLTVTKSPVTVTVAADNNPAVTGQPVTFTATVAAAGVNATPTGDVEFQANGSDLPGCSAVALDGTGAATCSVPTGFTPSTETVVASYVGDASFAAGDNSASPLSEVVNPASTATSIGVDQDPAVVGQGVTFTANVVVTAPGSTNAVTPDGSVEFTANGLDLPGCSAVEIDATGAAQCSVPTGFAAGSQYVVAIYTGDSNFAGSDTSAAPLNESVAKATTSTSLTADNSTLVTGQPVTFTADVAVNAPGTSGAVLPSGTVEFSANGTDLLGCGAVPVDSTGTASCTVAAGFAPSTQTIAAAYAGDANYVGSAASSLNESITPDDTTTAVVATANPPVAGQSVTYTATVAPIGPGAGAPTGTATFTVTGPKKPALTCTAGNAVALTATTGGSTATCAIPASKLTVGATYTVTVAYSGDGGFNASSGSLQQTIGQGATAVSVTSSASPSVANAAVTFTASVAAVSPASGNPTGTVTFAIHGADGSLVTCKNDTVKVASGKCVVPAGELLAAGSPYTVVATYSGSPAFTSSSGSFSQQVAKGVTTTKLQQSAAKTKAGQPATFTATVKPTPAARAPLGGSVTFTVTGESGDVVACNGSGSGSTTASGGGDYVATCTVPASVLTAADGPYQVVATYSGDANEGSSSASVAHAVSKAAQ